MTEKELRQALQGSVEAVSLSEAAKAAIMEEAKEDRPMKRKLSAGLVLVLVMLLLTTAALAAGRDILEWIEHSAGKENLLPGAQEMVQHPLAEKETEHATYTVREAIYDGRAVYLLLDIKPREANTFLLNGYQWAERPVSRYVTGAEHLEQSLADYAAEHGYTRFLSVGALPEALVRGALQSSWQDGVLTLLMEWEASGDTLPVALRLWVENEAGERTWDSLSFTLTAPKVLWERSAQPVAEVPDYGLRIDALSLSGTALAAYYQVDYAITDYSLFPGEVFFDLMDEQGNYLHRGALSVIGSDGILDNDGDMRIWRGGVEAMAQPPERLVLAMEIWEEEFRLIWTQTLELK